jgi:RNA polymerase sigma factor (sigma-70 family)
MDSGGTFTLDDRLIVERTGAEYLPEHGAIDLNDPREAALQRAMYDLAMRYAKRLLDYDDACDLVQNVVVDMIYTRQEDPKYLAEYLDEPSAIGPYLRVAVRNAYKNLIRAEKRRRARDRKYCMELEALRPRWNDPSQHEIDSKRLAIIHEGLTYLSTRVRRAFTRTQIDGLTYQEAADEAGVQPGTIHAQVSRAFRFLRDWAAKQEESRS